MPTINQDRSILSAVTLKVTKDRDILSAVTLKIAKDRTIVSSSNVVSKACSIVSANRCGVEKGRCIRSKLGYNEDIADLLVSPTTLRCIANIYLYKKDTATTYSFSNDFGSLEINLRENEPTSWTLTILDKDGTYSPFRTGTYLGILLPDIYYLATGRQVFNKEIIAKLNVLGEEFLMPNGIILNYSYGETPDGIGHTISGTDYSNLLLASDQTMPAWVSGSNRLVTATTAASLPTGCVAAIAPAGTIESGWIPVYATIGSEPSDFVAMSADGVIPASMDGYRYGRILGTASSTVAGTTKMAKTIIQEILANFQVWNYDTNLFTDYPVRRFYFQGDCALNKIREILEIRKAYYRFDGSTFVLYENTFRENGPADWTYEANDKFDFSYSVSPLEMINEVDISWPSEFDYSQEVEISTDALTNPFSFTLSEPLASVGYRVISSQNCGVHLFYYGYAGGGFSNPTQYAMIPGVLAGGSVIETVYFVLSTDATSPVPFYMKILLTGRKRVGTDYGSQFDDSFFITVKDSDSQAKFGVKKLREAIINPLIPTKAVAKTYGKALLDETGRSEKKVAFSVPFNPLLKIGDTICVINKKFASTDEYFRVTAHSIRITHEEAISTIEASKPMD